MNFLIDDELDQAAARGQLGLRPWTVDAKCPMLIRDANGDAIAVLPTDTIAAIIVACVNAPSEGTSVVIDPRCARCGQRQQPCLIQPEAE